MFVRFGVHTHGTHALPQQETKEAKSDSICESPDVMLGTEHGYVLWENNVCAHVCVCVCMCACICVRMYAYVYF